MTVIQINTIVDDVALDMGTTDEIDNDSIRKFVSKAIKRLNRIFKINGITDTISQCDEYCDIEVADDKSEIYPDLITLQTECLISKRRYYEAVSKGIKIKSGSDSVDTTSSFGGYSQLTSEFCDELNRSLNSFLDDNKSDDVVDGGTLIWYGEQREYWENEDYDNSRKNFRSPFDNGTEMD